MPSWTKTLLAVPGRAWATLLKMVSQRPSSVRRVFRVMALPSQPGGQRVDVVGGLGLAQLVHVVADLVGDAPAKQAVGWLAPVAEVGLPWTRGAVEPYSTPMCSPAAYMKAPANMRM